MDFFIIFGAKYLVFIVVLGAIAAVLMSRRRNELALLALVALPVAYALARVAGFLLSHPQPFAAGGFEPLVPHEVDNSFPSDHTLFAGVFASIAFLADRRFGLALWALALLVGVSRVLAGLHYDIDILVSIALALAVTWLAHTLFRNFGRYWLSDATH